MKLTPHVYVVGGGRFGFGISGRSIAMCTCSTAGARALALVDPGLGLGRDFAERSSGSTFRADGLDPRRIRKLIPHALPLRSRRRRRRSRRAAGCRSDHVGPPPPVISGHGRRTRGLARCRQASRILPRRFHPATVPRRPRTRRRGSRDGRRFSCADRLRDARSQRRSPELSLRGSDRTYLLGADSAFGAGKFWL